MQLPHTLSPALCCLLALAVQHVAGLAVPRGALGIGAEVEFERGPTYVENTVGASVGHVLKGLRGPAQRRRVAIRSCLLDAQVAVQPPIPNPRRVLETAGQAQRRKVTLDSEAKGEAGAQSSFTGGRVHRRQTPGDIFKSATEAAADAVRTFQVAAIATGGFRAITDSETIVAAVAPFQTAAETATAAVAYFLAEPKRAADFPDAGAAVVGFQAAARAAAEAADFLQVIAKEAAASLAPAAAVVTYQEAAATAAAAAATFRAAAEAGEAALIASFFGKAKS